MTSRDFCYWLQGFFEIHSATSNEELVLTPQQVKIIERHLALVFKHEIDPSIDNGDPQMISDLNKIHTGKPITYCNQTPLDKPVARC